jgi:hypothetical protein
MKLLLMAAAAVALSGADLGAFKTVYLLPMSNGLDQYLAMRLTSDSVMQVVTDPQKADSILTDKIGKSFEEALDDLYGNKKKDENEQPTMQPVTRGHGAIFLVDRKTRDVVWSTYERPKTSMPDELSRTADKIAKRLEKDRKGKQQ